MTPAIRPVQRAEITFQIHICHRDLCHSPLKLKEAMAFNQEKALQTILDSSTQYDESTDIRAECCGLEIELSPSDLLLLMNGFFAEIRREGNE